MGQAPPARAVLIGRWPLIPTILVAAAIAAMIGLGVWQLQRRTEKLELLERLERSAGPAADRLADRASAAPLPLFRAASGHCLSVAGFRTAAGRNRKGETGFLVIADCRVGAEGPGMAVELGWTKNPALGRDYKGGKVSGIIAPDSVARMRLVSSEPGPGLVASAPPSPESIPNNHLSYAIQWFLFAAFAGVIYVLALRRRERDEEARRMAELTRLANGVTVAIDPMEGAQSASIGLYAAVGSRSEADGKGGLAHLVEHMVFKGARGRDARGIAEAIEDVGGSLNAWTARDQTVFHARTLAPDVGLGLELIADLVRAPRLDEEELEREKLVILSELGECLDAPDDLIHDYLFEAAYGDQPVARPVLGREPTINAISRGDCTSWLAEQYRPERLVISAAGKVDPGHILNLAEVAVRRP